MGLLFGGREIDPQKMSPMKVKATWRLIDEAGGCDTILDEMEKMDFVGDKYKSKVNNNLGATTTGVTVGTKVISHDFSPKKRGKTVTVFTKQAAIYHVQSFFQALSDREWELRAENNKAKKAEKPRVRVLPPKPLSLPTCIRMHVEECLRGEGSVIAKAIRQWCDVRRATHAATINLFQEVCN